MPKVWWFVFAYNAKYDKKCFFKRQVGTQPGWHLVTNKCIQKWKRNATKHMNQPKLLYLKCKWFTCFVPHSFTIILKLGLKSLVVIEEWNCSQMWCLVLLLVESTWIIISMHNHLASLRTHFSVAKCSNCRWLRHLQLHLNCTGIKIMVFMYHCSTKEIPSC